MICLDSLPLCFEQIWKQTTVPVFLFDSPETERTIGINQFFPEVCSSVVCIESLCNKLFGLNLHKCFPIRMSINMNTKLRLIIPDIV